MHRQTKGKARLESERERESVEGGWMGEKEKLPTHKDNPFMKDGTINRMK